MKKLLIASLTAGVLAATLAGCSASEAKNDATPKPTASSAATSNDPRVGDTRGAAENLDKCVDGLLRVTDAAKAKPALAEGCDTVEFWVTAAAVEIGPVKTLSIAGSNNSIDVKSAGSIDIEGTNNTVTYGGVEPAGVDKIKHNEIVAAK